MDAKSVDAETAGTVLERWEKRDEKVDASEREVYQLAETYAKSLKEGARYLSTRKSLETELPQIVKTLSTNPSAEGQVREIETKAREAFEKVEGITPQGWRFLFAQRKRAELIGAFKTAFNKETSVLQEARGAIRRIAERLGLPSLREDTVEEFSKLEATKDEARKLRAPIDQVLQGYVPALQKILPDASLAYRGSLTRGVKSPSKFIETSGGIAVAGFGAKSYLKARGSAKALPVDKASFDIDANIEVPVELLHRHGLEEGPLSRNDQSEEVVKKLVVLQGQIGTDIVKAAAKIPGYDTSSPFELFISTPSKAGGQLDTGIPYPPYMLQNAGLPGLARDLPHAFAGELVRKVMEYYQRNMLYRGEVVPPEFWEPYYRKLYRHIREHGPDAVFMPEVQVLISGSGTEEFTDTPLPRVTTRIKEPTDLLAREKVIGSATGAGDLKRNAKFIGRVAKKVRPRDRVKPPFAFVDLGAGQEGFLGDARAVDEGDRKIVYVIAPPTATQKAKLGLAPF